MPVPYDSPMGLKYFGNQHDAMRARYTYMDVKIFYYKSMAESRQIQKSP